MRLPLKHKNSWFHTLQAVKNRQKYRHEFGQRNPRQVPYRSVLVL